MNLEIYQDKLRERGSSVFRGQFDALVGIEDIQGPEILNAFLEDDDIQEITVTSTNIGFTRTITKMYRKESK